MPSQASVKTKFCLLFLGLFLRNYLFKMLREETWPLIQYFSGNNRHFSSGLTVLQLTLFLYKHLYTWGHYLTAHEDLWSTGFALLTATNTSIVQQAKSRAGCVYTEAWMSSQESLGNFDIEYKEL